jgi:hypothetical protein
VAYASDASSTFQVYVEPFPKGTGSKFQISMDGGDRPRWRRDGRELFYMTADGRLMAVPMAPDGGSQSSPMQLFDTQMGSSWPYMVSPDGQTFYMTVPATPATGDMATIVLNWASLVRKKAN